MNITEKKIRELNETFEDAAPERILKWAVEEYGEQAPLSTGFGASGIVLMHQLSRIRPGALAFYLDTDLLFKETYELIDRIQSHMDLQLVRVRTPVDLEEQARKHGEKLWESQPDLCCHIRKVLPLENFLKDKKAWITGLRRDQSETRRHTPILQWNDHFKVLKICPLAGWTEEEVWSYIYVNDLPYNTLHDQGYPSIGCWPCTRAVGNDGDLRSGRWSGKTKTECGLHVK